MHGRGFEIVVAIHYGEAVVGTLGYGKTRQLTAIGDAVNMAARIETIGKEENASLLVSQSTFDNLAGDFRVGRTFTRTLKGKTGDHLSACTQTFPYRRALFVGEWAGAGQHRSRHPQFAKVH